MGLIRLYILLALCGGSVYEGHAPHYARNLMDRVAARRDLAPAPCMVSSPRYAIGSFVYVYGKQTGALRHCKVVDVSADADRARHIRTGREVELDYAVTAAICGTTRGSVAECGVIVIRLEEP